MKHPFDFAVASWVKQRISLKQNSFFSFLFWYKVISPYMTKVPSVLILADERSKYFSFINFRGKFKNAQSREILYARKLSAVRYGSWPQWIEKLHILEKVNTSMFCWMHCFFLVFWFFSPLWRITIAFPTAYGCPLNYFIRLSGVS